MVASIQMVQRITTVFFRLGGVAVFLIALWSLWILVLALTSGYSKQEMDWNGDGSTTLAEV